MKSNQRDTGATCVIPHFRSFVMPHFCGLLTVRTHKSFLLLGPHRKNPPSASAAPKHRGSAPNRTAGSAGRKHCSTEPPRSIASPVGAAVAHFQAVTLSVVAPLGWRRHPARQLRQRTLRSGVTEVWHPPESYLARDLNGFVEVRHVRSNKSLERTREK